jgi:hypothetical protein
MSDLPLSTIDCRLLRTVLKSSVAFAPTRFDQRGSTASRDRGPEHAGAAEPVVVGVYAYEKERLVALGGIIDRVDLLQQTIRLIDYKSGIDAKEFKDIPSLFDRTDKKRNKAAMQTLFYGLLYQANYPDNTLPLKPAIFNLREIFRDDFNPYLQEKPDRNSKQEVQNYLDYREDYETALKNTLEEIFDPQQAFDQTEDLDKCRTCPYADICAR